MIAPTEPVSVPQGARRVHAVVQVELLSASSLLAAPSSQASPGSGTPLPHGPVPPSGSQPPVCCGIRQARTVVDRVGDGISVAVGEHRDRQREREAGLLPRLDRPAHDAARELASAAHSAAQHHARPRAHFCRVVVDEHHHIPGQRAVESRPVDHAAVRGVDAEQGRPRRGLAGVGRDVDPQAHAARRGAGGEQAGQEQRRPHGCLPSSRPSDPPLTCCARTPK